MDSSDPKGTCSLCNQICVGKVYDVAGHLFHRECFCCSTCKKPLDANNIRFRNEKLYCFECYTCEFGRLCSVCKQYITEDTFVEAMGQFFHTNHFTCFLCKSNFDDKKFCKKEVFFMDEMKYRPFCNDCVKLLKRIPCKKCNGVISGQRSYVNNCWYHYECFKSIKETLQMDYLAEIPESSSECEISKEDLKKQKMQIRKEREQLEQDIKDFEEQKRVFNEQVNQKETRRISEGESKPIFRRDNSSTISKQLRDSYSPVQNSALFQPTSEESNQTVGTVSRSSIASLANDELPIYTLEQLTTQPYPEDVDLTRREYHLSDAEFSEVFGMTKEQFETLPTWKRINLRKQHRLF